MRELPEKNRTHASRRRDLEQTESVFVFFSLCLIITHIFCLLLHPVFFFVFMFSLSLPLSCFGFVENRKGHACYSTKSDKCLKLQTCGGGGVVGRKSREGRRRWTRRFRFSHLWALGFCRESRFSKVWSLLGSSL